MEREIALEMRGVSKYFGSVVANKNVNLKVYKGEILAVLGENGSGKTTLMNMISGIYFPDEGQTFVDGEEAVIRSPQDAFAYKIGMIHQHFKLVDVFTAAQNIVLGEKNEPKPVDDKKNAFSKFFAKIGRKMESGLYKKKEVAAQVKEIADKYGFEIDPNKKIYNMSVSEKQTVEIVKVLYRGANVLILDEPTAVLTPQETEKLFAVLRKGRQVHHHHYPQTQRSACRIRSRGDFKKGRIRGRNRYERRRRKQTHRIDGGQESGAQYRTQHARKLRGQTGNQRSECKEP